MINITSLVTGIIFSVLILAIIAIVLHRRHSRRYAMNACFNVLKLIDECVTFSREKVTHEVTVVLEEEKSSRADKSVRIPNGRKPIPINELKRELELLEADSAYELSREYERIREISSERQASCSVAELPENRVKNRYCDIVPCKFKLASWRARIEIVLTLLYPF